MLFIIMVIGLTIFISILLVFTLVELLFSRLLGKPFIIYTHLRVRNLNDHQDQFLRTRFPHYGKLSARKQKIFGHRVLQYKDNKEFILRGELTITEPMKLLISATAVMLTFGMRRYMMPSVKRFVIYPCQYESVINKAEHIGEYNPALKTIVFSWKDFIKGHQIKDDNLNLGVHEFAHALSYESLKVRDSGGLLFSDGLHKIDKLLRSATFQKHLQTSAYFREYAQVNKFEFFAVALEHFIETPGKFRSEFPNLYHILIRMLNYQFVYKAR
jgi:Mlc titration factor MtfA (ptsG expression regulator)